MLKKSPRDKSPPLPDDERCIRNDGKQWRCRQRRAEGRSMCDYHFQYQRNKILCKRNSKSNFSRKNEVKSGMKSRRPVELKSTTSDIYEISDEYSSGEDTSTEMENDMDQQIGEKRKSISLEERAKIDNKGKQIIDLSDEEYISDGEEKNGMSQRVGEKRKSISLEKIENEGKQIISLYGTEYKSDGEEKNGRDQRVGEKRKSISLAKVEKIDNKGKQIIDLSDTEYESDGEEKNDMDQRVGEKRKSISLEEEEKFENKGKQISDMSGSEYKSSTQMGVDSKEKPELSEKIFRGEDPQMCNQCQRNDEGKVISCMACKKERFCVPCTKRWQNPMDSDTETRKEENRTFSDLELEITQLETKLLEEKIRYEHLRTENDMNKSECSNLKIIIAALEKENNKFRGREAQNLNKITKMYEMMASYNENLVTFMKKCDG